MRIRKSVYYDSFRCIAGACPDSCCKEWDVQVDEASAAYYRTLPGELGNRLRTVLKVEDGETVMTIIDGRCPMWRTDGLCEIQAQLGHDALCKTCRDFPRLRHDYGSFVELGLELSCPEAAKFILADRQFQVVEEEIQGGTEPEYDEEAMEVLLRTRDLALGLLEDPAISLPRALTLLLFYGYHAQAELDGEEQSPFNAAAVLNTAAQFAESSNFQEVLDFFAELEILTPDWQALLSRPEEGEWTAQIRAMAGYLVRRYWLHAVSDYDLVCRVKFILIACLLVKRLGGDIYRTAQLFSKEIENSTDNVDAILDAAYCHPAFTDAKLLGWLR